MKKVLFVCTGNTCRSCMAEGIFNSLVSQVDGLRNDYRAVSAGLAAWDGDGASRNAIDALKQQWGIDISNHVSRRITAGDVKEASLILTMTRSHKRALLAEFPEAEGKVYTLKEYAYTNGCSSEADAADTDIPDPYGMPLEVYKSCAGTIRAAVEAVLKKLVNSR